MENLFSSLKLFYKALSSGNELCTIDSFKEIKILCPNCLETWNFLLNDSDVLEQLIFRGIITFPNLFLGNSNFIETCIISSSYWKSKVQKYLLTSKLFDFSNASKTDFFLWKNFFFLQTTSIFTNHENFGKLSYYIRFPSLWIKKNFLFWTFQFA